jgi:imidazolonepropionase-like amidohydrolase
LLLTAGRGLVAPTPGSQNGGPFFAADTIVEVSTAEQARAAVRQLSEKRPDVIKFWLDDRSGTKAKMSPAVYTAIVDEAHRLGHQVVAHIYSLEDAKGAIEGGVDGIAHMVRDPGPDAELLDLMVSRKVFAFTSMSIQKGMPEGTGWLDDPALAQTVDKESRAAVAQQINDLPDNVVDHLKRGYEILQAGLRSYRDAGVRIVMSTDTGLLTQFFGFSEHREIEAMVEAGLPALDAIRAATATPAEILNLPDRGTLEVGKRADLLVLEADPVLDISNTRKIAAVYFAGRLVDRNALRAGFASDGRNPISGADAWTRMATSPNPGCCTS